jgi:hypothetical protein
VPAQNAPQTASRQESFSVNIVLAYLVPIDAWDAYAASAERFAQTYQQFPAEIEHELVVVCCNGPAAAGYARVRAVFKGLAKRFEIYHGGGWDVGAGQSIANKIDTDFLVCANAGVYFSRAGWLQRFAEARIEHGEGLYGAGASFESSPFVAGRINPHIRTSFYGCNSASYRRYPHTIDSREKSLRFEAGEWNFMQWFESRGQPSFMVTWDGCYAKENFRTPPNVFRKGDQSNLIIHDRYIDLYAQGNAQQRQQMESYANAGLTLY